MLHNEELHSLYRSPKIVRVIKSRRLRWASHLTRIEEVRSAFKMLTGKILLGRPRRRCVGNISIDVNEIRINTRNWVHSAQGRNY